MGVVQLEVTAEMVALEEQGEVREADMGFWGLRIQMGV